MSVTPLAASDTINADAINTEQHQPTASASTGVPWHQQFRRLQIVRSLEAVQDMIAVSLCVGLFCIMALQLKEIFASLLNKPQ